MQAGQIKPLQRLSYAEKSAKKFEWAKKCLDYYIASSKFHSHENFLSSAAGDDLQQLYDIYNGVFPPDWTGHISDPLKADDPKHKNWPAKIRPIPLLRSNLELLQGEFIRRPFSFYVENLSEEAVNTFIEDKKKIVVQHILELAADSFRAQGLDPETDESVKAALDEKLKQFEESYKDQQAVKGNKLLKRLVVELEIVQEWRKMIKDYCITGEAYSYKQCYDNSIDYCRISPKDLDSAASESAVFIEDRDWVVCRKLMTVADMLELFGNAIEEKDWVELEKLDTIQQRYQDFVDYATTNGSTGGLLRVYHINWTSRKEIGLLQTIDPITGKQVEMEVDENYPRNTGEQIEWMWRNEKWEGYRIEDKWYSLMRPIPLQREDLGIAKSPKNMYNGRLYSDTHSANVSPLILGIPFQIMWIIINFKLEMTIAQSKGKIVLMDKNVIPRTNGWTEEKFFWHAEASGWGLIDRNQTGADRSYNQYQVLDRGLFDHITNLIGILDYIKGEWNDLLGISRQRRGNVTSSDTVQGTQIANFQSTVITETLFTSFEELLVRDLQGILDYSRVAYSSGMKRLYNVDEEQEGSRIFDIIPEDYCNAALGVYVVSGAIEKDKLEKVRGIALNMANNSQNPLMAIEALVADSITELKVKLKKLMENEQKLAMQTEKAKEDAEAKMLAIKHEYDQFLSALEVDAMHQEYDRKEVLLGIGNEQDVELDRLGNEKIITDATQTANKDNMTAAQERSEKAKDRELEREKLRSKEKIEDKKAKIALKNKVSGEK